MPISAAPATSPSPSPTYSPATTTSDDATTASQTGSKIDFSPPLIAMVIVIITAFLIITYSRLISKHIAAPFLNRLRHWRRSSHVSASSSTADLQSFHHSNSNLFDQTDHYQTFSPYGLDDSVIKTIPLSIYNNKNSRTNSQTGKKQSIVEVVIAKDCAVCLLEFEENDYVRTLPICSHAFHVDCIDIWLRSNANCPLCRAKILCSQIQPQTSPFVPLMAGRIRPSIDGILASIHLDPLNEIHSENNDSDHRIQQTPEQSSCSISDFDFDHRNRNLLLKRSYSFEYERTFQPSTTSPWRRSTTAAGFWSKRRLSVSSPFSALTKSRVFSFRSTRLTKSPFFARRGRGLVMFPFSETSSLSRRRSKSMASPASSRLRCGDPEALLSPERYNRR